MFDVDPRSFSTIALSMIKSHKISNMILWLPLLLWPNLPFFKAFSRLNPNCKTLPQAFQLILRLPLLLCKNPRSSKPLLGWNQVAKTCAKTSKSTFYLWVKILKVLSMKPPKRNLTIFDYTNLNWTLSILSWWQTTKMIMCSCWMHANKGWG